MIIFFYLFISVLLIVTLSSYFKINPAFSLFIGSFLLGILLQMSLSEIVDFQLKGFIISLEGIGVILLLGCLIGQFLFESKSINKFGNIFLYSLKNNSLLSMNLIGLFVGTVVFCDSAFIILNGISKSIASSSSFSLLSLNLSLSGGLYASHTLIPPTPGPIGAINNFNMINHIGYVMIFGFFISLPASITSFFFARNLLKERNIILPISIKKQSKPHIFSYLSILIPLIIIGLGSLLNLININENDSLFNFIKTICNPKSALFIGLIFSIFIPRKEKNISKIFKNSMKDFIPIISVTTMGAAFGNIIKNSNLSKILPSIIQINEISIMYILLISFFLSALFKTSQGSSTSSMIIVSSIIFPIISEYGFDIFDLTMVILSIGCGSMMVSHINDSYFWIVIKNSNLNLNSGLKYFSLLTILQSFIGFLFIIFLTSLFSL